MVAPGPPELGRGVVVRTGDPVPAPWRDAPVVVIDAEVVASPGPAVAELHRRWSARAPVVIELAVDPGTYRAPQTTDAEPWSLEPRFEVAHDRLHFLTWANTYDARDGKEPVWWWAHKAARQGATVADGPDGDVVLPSGEAAWVDGGPRAPLALAPIVHSESVDLGRLTVQPAPVAPSASLAPDQLAAVAHGAGPARIVAPAGSGKTRVLTERLRHLVVDRGIETELVLAVAYNKKAQLEMESRTTEFRPRVSTLNALGHRLLGSPRVLEEREVRHILGDLVPARRRMANTDPIAPYLEGLTAVRLGLRSPAEVEDERDDVPGLAQAFAPYRAALRRAAAVDFDEQVYGAVELLLRDGAARRRAQAACRHLLVDELQDLTPAHVLLLRLLASPALDVFGVGDDDQVIYQHGGADPAFLIGYSSLFPGAADHPLEVNYRCPVAVVDAARHLLDYNDRRVGKTVRPGPSAVTGDDALVVRQHQPEDGARAVVSVVRDWLDDGTPATDVAVLTRVNALLLPPHVALVEAGVPVQSSLPRDVLERTGVRAALAYLRLGASPGAMEPKDLIEILRRPSRGFPQWFAKWLRRPMGVAELRGLSGKIDDDKVGAKVQSLADDLAVVIDAVSSGTTRSALTVVRDVVGLGSAMHLLDGSKGSQTASQLDDLEALIQVADLHPDPASFESWLRGVLARSPDGEGVTLSTIHRVKGMEWPRVVVAGVSGGIVPHRLAEDVEEERRVLHVAITRCGEQVVVLGDATRMSPFLAELDGRAPRRSERALRPTLVTPIPNKAPPASVALSSEDEAVFEALRAWRLGRSRFEEVPAYVVVNDATLKAIAAERPDSLAALRQIPGIGPTKLERYGEEILEVLEAG